MPIRVWNGSAWIQPQFWTGSAWRRQNDYQAATGPTYANAGSWDFNSGVQGWYGSTYDNADEPYWTGGTKLRQDITQAGLFSSAWGGVSIGSLRIGMSVQYRVRASITVIRRSGTSTNNPTLTLGAGSSTQTWTLNAGNTGWAEYATPFVTSSSTNDYTFLDPSIQLNAGDLSSNSLYSYECDWLRLENSSGNLLQYMVSSGTPAVEAWPKWWNGSSWI